MSKVTNSLAMAHATRRNDGGFYDPAVDQATRESNGSIRVEAPSFVQRDTTGKDIRAAVNKITKQAINGEIELSPDSFSAEFPRMAMAEEGE